MANSIVVFVAWPDGVAGDVGSFPAKWKAATFPSSANWPTAVQYKPQAKPLHPSSKIKKIYVAGHGDAGVHTIHTKLADGAYDAGLTYEMVAQRLIDSGLDSGWSGEIILHNCASGVPGVGRQSFAAKFAQHMRAKHKMYGARFAGYVGKAVSSYLTTHGVRYKDVVYPPSGDPKAHKWVLMPGNHVVKSKFCKVYF